MQFVQWQIIQSPSGAIVPYGKVAVYLPGTSTPVQLYDVAGSAIANPAVADVNGQVGMRIADGEYDFHPQFADGTPCAPAQTNVEVYDAITLVGARGNDSADDQPAFMAAIASQKANAILGYQYGNASFQVNIPKGTPAYRLASSISVDISARFRGQGTGSPPGIWATLLHPDAGVTAIINQSWNTFGATGDDAGDLFTGAGSIYDGIGVIGHYNGTTVVEGEFHAWQLRGGAALINCGGSDIQGDVVNIEAGVATPGKIGNANGWYVNRLFGQRCRSVIRTRFSDSNVGVAIGVSGSEVRGFGIDDASGENNTYLGGNFQLCGVSGVGTAANPAACCHKTGNHYYVRAGQETGAATNAPTGTTSSNTWWVWFETGGIVNPGFVDWFNGIVCRAGGVLRLANSGLGVGVSYEGSEPPPQNGLSAGMIGGTWGAGRPQGGGYITFGSNQTIINDILVERGGVQTADDVSAGLVVGRYNGGTAAIISAGGLATSMTLSVPGSQFLLGAPTEVDIHPFSGHGWFFLSGGLLAPFTDNAQDFGSSSKRIANLWCANATIQTSDAQHKSHERNLSGPDFDKLLDAVGAVPLLAFKMKDAVAEKGEDHARDHYGIRAQDLHDELVRHGLDPFAGGVLGRDMVLEEVEEEVEVEQEAMRMEYQYEDHNEIVDGKVIRRQTLVEKPEPDFLHLPVHDEDGNPVIIPARPAGKSKMLVDGKLVEVEVAGRPERQVTHPVRRMERVKVMMPRQRVKLDENGDEEFIWNVRYAEFHTLHAAWQRRELARLQKGA